MSSKAVKKPRGRIAEQRYAKRVLELKAKRKKGTKDDSRTPWKHFFDGGRGATITTEIPKASIRAIVYKYGKKLGKRFVCSYEEQDGCVLVKIEAVKRR